VDAKLKDAQFPLVLVGEIGSVAVIERRDCATIWWLAGRDTASSLAGCRRPSQVLA
jgi:hypothetical protein